MQLGFHGQILADWTIHGQLPARSSSIKSWDNKGFATKTGAEMRAFLRGDKRTAYWHEAVFSNAVGPGKYVLFVIPYSIDGTTIEYQREVIRKGRVACFDYLIRIASAA